MISFLRPLVLPLLLLAAAPAYAQDHGHEDHKASLGGMTVIHAWTRATPKGDDTIVFFEIENAGEPVVLNGGEAENAASVEVVGAHMGADGMLAYQPVGAFEIPAGNFAFDPNGLGLRLNDLTTELQHGQHFHLHLAIGDGELEISVDVEEADAMAHSHAGHSH